jgi:hypothetical protein
LTSQLRVPRVKFSNLAFNNIDRSGVPDIQPVWAIPRLRRLLGLCD